MTTILQICPCIFIACLGTWPNVPCAFSMRRISAWFLANYIEAKNMRFPCIYPYAWKMHVAHLAVYSGRQKHFIQATSLMISGINNRCSLTRIFNTCHMEAPGNVVTLAPNYDESAFTIMY